jgi:hypothetical protein
LQPDESLPVAGGLEVNMIARSPACVFNFDYSLALPNALRRRADNTFSVTFLAVSDCDLAIADYFEPIAAPIAAGGLRLIARLCGAAIMATLGQ